MHDQWQYTSFSLAELYFKAEIMLARAGGFASAND
jgi:hypothetical protein